ncbi:SRPBCC family protein [Tessaracoccus rhinocerotis]|uniref:SRPBCC family protein n=1 Tax=Tessaracoccus rhinocerotis TaxID=1689449 RepID=A0A553JXC2_9ACTN|nr:SRPBCC family protein [Tessaracoccus rhinocerotis]TRY17117.1 SRPBCC family protein [Tessaracoccus rhinocerotis]
MITPTSDRGTKQVHDGQDFVEFTRTFRAPAEDVWAAVTDPGRLARWIGSWRGDPADGEVWFRMLFEGDEIPEEHMAIHQCDAPHRLRVTSTSPSEEGPQVWDFRIDLVEANGVTTLTFAQSVPDAQLAEGVGPGWQYYLDRLMLAETGADPADIDFDDYYPALKEHYRELFA